MARGKVRVDCEAEGDGEDEGDGEGRASLMGSPWALLAKPGNPRFALVHLHGEEKERLARVTPRRCELIGP